MTKQNPTFTADVADLSKMAQAAGIKNARDVWVLSEFRDAYNEALEYKGPSVIVAKVPPLFEDWQPPTSIFMDSQRAKYRLIEHLWKSEKIEVLLGA